MSERRTPRGRQNQNQSQQPQGAQKHYSKEDVEPARLAQSNDWDEASGRGADGSATRDGAFEGKDDVDPSPGVQRDRHQRPR